MSKSLFLRKSHRAFKVPPDPGPYWSRPVADVLQACGTSPNGLAQREALARLKRYGPNSLTVTQSHSVGALAVGQFRNPLVLILIVACGISLVVAEWVNALVVLAIVLLSTLLGFTQEYVASRAIDKLRSRIRIHCRVWRGGTLKTMPSEHLVPGDVVELSAGSLIPADGLVLSCRDFFVNQAVLTGETFPVEKRPGNVKHSANLSERSNCVFMGSSVSSGMARVLLVQTGKDTVYGHIAERLSLRPALTDFERGVHRFGYLLTRIMLVMVLLVMGVNMLMSKPAVDSLLFALALAVGLTPEMLPAIVSITLSHGAKRMAGQGVLVRRLNAIETLGSMDVLCTDKTGTLTQGVVQLDRAVATDGQPDERVLQLAGLNATYQSGLVNPLDQAIASAMVQAQVDISAYHKVDEIPYDFVRKCLSVVVVDGAGAHTLITKGALAQVLAMCQSEGTARNPLDTHRRDEIESLFGQWSAQGFRVLGLASKPIDARQVAYSREDEQALNLDGFLLFMDPPKPGVLHTLQALAQRGVQLKIITGDNAAVARHVALAVDLPATAVVTGRDLLSMSDAALMHVARQTSVFAEVDPNQKERIILALQKAGHVVGYMGDGINDALALHSADLGISVDTAVDVAKEAADFVLLQPDLSTLTMGIDEGRKTFANTLKYILTTISANFGNMVSMAVASIFLPFLPLLASQVLLNNFLSDIPAATLAGDRVDPEWVAGPRRWDTDFIRNYMVVFGLISSLFDFLTFGALLWLFESSSEEFRTGWFVESLLTELLVALVVRTRGPFFRSRPGSWLMLSTIGVVSLALVLPYLPWAAYLGFVPLPISVLLGVIGLTLVYGLTVELTKQWFYWRMSFAP